MANTFPIHLERQLEILYSQYVKRLAAVITPPLFRKFKKENPELVETDALSDDLVKLPEEAEKKDPSTLGKMVTVGAIVIPVFMFDGITRVFRSLDEWSFEKMLQETRVLGRKRGVPQLADLLQKQSVATENILLKAVKTNANLIKNIRAETTNAVAEEVRQAVLKGRSSKVLARRLKRITGVKASKADFWAADQIGSVQSDLNFKRLQDSGFPAYKWNTSRDSRVRPDHIWREGRVFTVAESDILPGKTPRCRCTPGPAFGQADASTPAERRKTLVGINRDRRKVNRLKKNKGKKPLEILGSTALEKPAESAA